MALGLLHRLPTGCRCTPWKWRCACWEPPWTRPPTPAPSWHACWPPRGISHEIAIPDISSKEKAQTALGMDMKQMNSDKAQFLKTTVPAWDAEAKAAGRLAQ